MKEFVFSWNETYTEQLKYMKYKLLVVGHECSMTECASIVSCKE